MLYYLIDEEELYLTVIKACFNITLSIGIVMIEEGGISSEKILSYANNALYTAKELGKNRIVFSQLDDNRLERFSKNNEIISLIKKSKPSKYSLI